MIGSSDRWVIAASAALALGAPILLLQQEEANSLEPARIELAQAQPLRSALPELAAIERPLFAPAVEVIAATASEGPATEKTAADEQPELIGIIGRLPDDAVALVRAEDGRSRTIKAGQSYRGWRLASIGSDAALFERGRERIRVGLDPVG